MDQRLKVLSQVLESNAWDSLKRSQRAWHNMMVTAKLGLTIVTQLKTLLLRRIQVVLELTIREPEEPSQVLVLIAKVSLRDTLTPMFSMMETNRTGLTNAMVHKIHGLKRTQVELELMKTNIKDLSQVLEQNAKDSLKSRVTALTFHQMLMAMLGLKNVTQLRTLSLKRIQVEQVPTKMKLNTKMQESNVRDLHKDIRTLMFSMMVINKTGLINAMQHKIHGLRRTQVELEPMKTKIKALSQESVLNARDSLR